MRLSRCIVLLSVVLLLIVFTVLLCPAAPAQQQQPQYPPQVMYGPPRPIYPTPIRAGIHWLFTPRAYWQPAYYAVQSQPQPLPLQQR